MHEIKTSLFLEKLNKVCLILDKCGATMYMYLYYQYGVGLIFTV